MQKKCFKCGAVKSLTDFYKHKQMGDGHLNKCKECTKNDAGRHRGENIEKIRAYDRSRGARQGYLYTKQYRARFPNKCKAHQKVNREKKAGNLHEQPCEICGDNMLVHAHHDDYLKPLNVRWLCAAHHSQWHAENGEALNP